MVSARKDARSKVLITEADQPHLQARRRERSLTTLAYAAVAVGVIAFWIASRRNIDQSLFANAQAATFDEPAATETLGTPGIADAHAVMNFRGLARHSIQAKMR